MKKNNLIVLIIFFLIIVIVTIVFLYYKQLENKKKYQLSPVTEEVSQTKIDPKSLDWQEVTASAQWQGRDSHAVVVFKNKIWVMGGVDATKRVLSPGNIDYANSQHFNDVWSSDDGKNWQLVQENAPWGKRRSIQVVVFQNKMWLIGGYGPEIGDKNDVWSSVDGINWKLEKKSAAWSAREGHQIVVFQNKMWLMGGVRYTGKQLLNDVWSSEDGITWSEVTKSSGWEPRWDFAATSYNNKLWVIGGMAFKDVLYNDVWSSEDGITWSLINKKPPFAAREGFEIVDYKDNLWVISRLDIPEYGNGVNDIWYSKNGIDWEKTEKNPLWNGKEDVGAVIFKDKIWVMGGMNKYWKWTNDVWVSTATVLEN